MPNENILHYLRTCRANNSLAHAYLLLGPKGSGRMELLKVFLAELIGKEGISAPDVRIVAPEEGKSVISIEQIRALREWLTHSPIKANQKAAIIQPSELMNQEAQNALLKSLEEPVANTYLFLLAGHRHQLLPTVVSRTVMLRHSARPLDFARGDEHNLIHQLFEARDMHERMRVWMKAALEKEEIPALLEAAIPILRSHMLESVEQNNFQKAKTLARAIRDIHVALAKPVGQNWGLVMENVIVSI